MDGFEEKKWFVYMGDHHEGPFSLAEIQTKMSHGQVSSSSYVWAEGMSDWKVMSEVPAFISLVAPARKPAAPEMHAEPAPSAELSLAPVLEEAPTNSSIEIVQLEARSEAAEPHARAARKDEASAEDSPKPGKKSHLGLFLLILVIILTGGGTIAFFQGHLDPYLEDPAVKASLKSVSDTVQPTLLKMASKYPALAKIVSPIPKLEDVSEAEYEELRQAASTPLEEGPRIAVAVSNTNPLMPFFYVSSNLPDGAAINVHVEGIPETLLNQLSFSGAVSVTLDKKLGKSAPIAFPDGRPVARGEYEVFAVEAPQQGPEVTAVLGSRQPLATKVPASVPRGFKIIASKKVFLGGAKDATYATRLKAFHDTLAKKALQELTDIKMLAATLEGELKMIDTKFDQLFKMKASAARKKAWNEFNNQHAPIIRKMKEDVEKWTPELIQNDFFYGVLFQMTQQAFQSLAQVYDLENGFMSGASVDMSSFTVQLGQARSTAENALALLKAKISKAENIPPAPNGMPRKEGLEGP